MTAADRCPTCDRARATDDDGDRHADADCDRRTCWCASLCWVDFGVPCTPVDWRARALAAEKGQARLYEAYTALVTVLGTNASPLVTAWPDEALKRT